MEQRSNALAPEYEASFEAALWMRFDKHPKYVLGGISDEEIDCSGLIGAAANDANIPGVKKRSQAYRIHLGLDGYSNRDVRLWDAKRGDLPFWRYPSGLVRPGGINHMGAVVLGRESGLYEFMHASGSRKTVVVDPFTRMQKHLAGLKRLTIGDPK